MKLLARPCYESHLRKSEVRKPKPEIPQGGTNVEIRKLSPLGFRSDFGFLSGFEFRISDFAVAASFFLFACVATAAENSYLLEVFPPEHRRMTDPKTGAELLFLTTAPEKDSNLYFHERSWLADESMILFNSSRPKGGLMGYLTATGELLRFNTPQGPLGGATAAAKGNAVFAVRGRASVEIRLAIQTNQTGPTRVTATERILCSLPDGSPATSLNVSCDGKYVALG